MISLPNQHRKRSAFTLIEVLVVVAIIALLIAILLPALKAAREESRATVCAARMKQISTAGTMWLQESQKDRVPTYLGWATPVLKRMSGEGELFTCPSDKDPSPIPAVSIQQVQGHESGRAVFSPDSAYFRRHDKSDLGIYSVDMEMGAIKLGYDKDYNDAILQYTVKGEQSPTGEVWGSRRATQLLTTLHNWRGQTLAELPQGGETPHFPTNILWGSYGMNLSAGFQDTKLFNVLFLEYEDWAAIVETGLGAETASGAVRVDDPAEMVGYRHNGQANVGFPDTHIERVHPKKLELPDDLRAGSLWHPARPPNWAPSF